MIRSVVFAACALMAFLLVVAFSVAGLSARVVELERSMDLLNKAYARLASCSHGIVVMTSPTESTRICQP